MATVFFSSPAEHDLKRLPLAAQDSLRTEHISRLAENRRTGKPLHGPLRGYFSYDFWSQGVSYRIAYELIKNDVIILMIDTRDNFYKKFLRRTR